MKLISSLFITLFFFNLSLSQVEHLEELKFNYIGVSDNNEFVYEKTNANITITFHKNAALLNSPYKNKTFYTMNLYDYNTTYREGVKLFLYKFSDDNGKRYAIAVSEDKDAIYIMDSNSFVIYLTNEN